MERARWKQELEMLQTVLEIQTFLQSQSKVHSVEEDIIEENPQHSNAVINQMQCFFDQMEESPRVTNN